MDQTRSQAELQECHESYPRSQCGVAIPLVVSDPPHLVVKAIWSRVRSAVSPVCPCARLNRFVTCVRRRASHSPSTSRWIGGPEKGAASVALVIVTCRATASMVATGECWLMPRSFLRSSCCISSSRKIRTPRNARSKWGAPVEGRESAKVPYGYHRN